jgi:phage-related protein
MSGDSPRQSKIRWDLSCIESNVVSIREIPMNSVGPGVKEIRVRDEAGIFQMIYLATRPDGVYVLHCFQKKNQRISRSDLELAEKRFRSIAR